MNFGFKVRFKPKIENLKLKIESGAVAQLGERLNGIQEVRGSNPLSSIVGGRSSGVEHLLPKQRVVSSNLIARS